MHEFLHTNPILHAVYHSVLILPLLYLAYLLMELIEHKTSNRFRKALSDDRRTGPVVGASIGLIPFCGFSDLAAGLYAGRVISIGTLVALLLSTSGETLLLAINYPDKILSVFVLILVKFVIAGLCGFILDLCLRNRQADIHIHDLCEEEHCECEHSNVFISAFKHTLPVFFLVLSFNFLIAVLELFGFIEGLAFIIQSFPALGVLFAALVGLIPGCAPLVLMLSLWNSGIISSAAFLAGLITSAGTGYIVLYKTNKSWTKNLLITLLIFLVGLITGSLFELTSLFEILGI
jgi:hypothetical protein